MRFFKRLTRLCLLLACGLALAPACAAEFAHHYEYVFFLRGKPTQDVVAQAGAALPTPLERHRLVEPAMLQRWAGKGQPPLALELRSMPLAEVRLNQVFDSGEPLAKMLDMQPNESVSALAVMIGVPPQLDVPAYIEALRLSAAVGKALRSPVFADIETGELLRTVSLEGRLRDGLRGDKRLVSTSNLPQLTIMNGITEFEELPDHGIRTHGLRRLGLPDIALERGMPGDPRLWLLNVVGNLLVSGKVPPAAGTVVTVRTDDPEVRAELQGTARRGGTARLRLARSALEPGPVLRMEIDGNPLMHEYERQMLFFAALAGPRYANLGEGQEQALLRSIAQAKVQQHELRDRLDDLRASGTRVFFASRMGELLQRLRLIGPKPVYRVWREFIGWTDDGQMLTHVWKGDPRDGGTAERLPKPTTIKQRSVEFVEIDMGEGDVEDILVIDARGKVRGGEVVALVRQLAVQTPSHLRR